VENAKASIIVFVKAVIQLLNDISITYSGNLYTIRCPRSLGMYWSRPIKVFHCHYIS